MNPLERSIRTHLLRALRDTAVAPSVEALATAHDVSTAVVHDTLRSLARQHRLALRPHSDDLWMAHPFSAVPTDFVVTAGGRSWWANCVWDGLAILGIVGDGWLDTHSPQTGESIRLGVAHGTVTGDAIVHFLVPARHFWDDIGFT